ncbi:hypothetical protein K457DRAFT_779275 [Linnemannia elongata AG-77]|uniref:Uncharacterized protein n=1 Tax=Linnemannia elongata AG-77 TaxID=1314771 RepID=A0A197KA74_9FUNG|nr:hypothetical protein K457DRAFT_779275 [Linnemannia elongata AG-77]
MSRTVLLCFDLSFFPTLLFPASNIQDRNTGGLGLIGLVNRAKVRDVLYTLCANKDGGVPLAVMRWCTRGQVCASEVRWEKEARRADVEIDRGRNKKTGKWTSRA